MGHCGEAELAAVLERTDDFLIDMVDDAVVAALEAHLHVALAATEPYLADEDVLDDELVAVGEGELIGREAALGRRQAELPSALGVAAGLYGLSAPRTACGDAAVGLGEAPELAVALLL